jgi:hypothetical protein
MLSNTMNHSIWPIDGSANLIYLSQLNEQMNIRQNYLIQTSERKNPSYILQNSNFTNLS